MVSVRQNCPLMVSVWFWRRAEITGSPRVPRGQSVRAGGSVGWKQNVIAGSSHQAECVQRRGPLGSRGVGAFP